jgi:hypothetical protein
MLALLPQLLSPKPRGHRVTLAVLMSAGLAASAAAGAADPSGAYASGYAFGDFLIGCETCSHYLLDLSGDPMPLDGGPGSAQASVSYSGTPLRVPVTPGLVGVPLDYTLGGSASLAATATVVGVLGSPRLGAMAYAANVPVFYSNDDPPIPIGVDVYQASATAEVIQRYTFTGTQQTTYTWNFTIDADLSSDQASVFGSVRFFDVFPGEVPIAAGGASLEGVGILHEPLPYSAPFSVSVTFDPGDVFYMQSQLTALVSMTYSSAHVTADAMNTMLVTGVTGGDTSLLIASLQPVPEPGTCVMFGVGLIGVGLAMGRRRSRSAPSGGSIA